MRSESKRDRVFFRNILRIDNHLQSSLRFLNLWQMTNGCGKIRSSRVAENIRLGHVKYGKSLLVDVAQIVLPRIEQPH